MVVPFVTAAISAAAQTVAGTVLLGVLLKVFFCAIPLLLGISTAMVVSFFSTALSAAAQAVMGCVMMGVLLKAAAGTIFLTVTAGCLALTTLLSGAAAMVATTVVLILLPWIMTFWVLSTEAIWMTQLHHVDPNWFMILPFQILPNLLQREAHPNQRAYLPRGWRLASMWLHALQVCFCCTVVPVEQGQAVAQADQAVRDAAAMRLQQRRARQQQRRAAETAEARSRRLADNNAKQSHNRDKESPEARSR